MWRMTEVKGTVACKFTGVLPLALGRWGEWGGDSTLLLFTLCIGPGVEIRAGMVPRVMSYPRF